MQLASKIIASGGQVVSAASNYGDLDAYAVMESVRTSDVAGHQHESRRQPDRAIQSLGLSAQRVGKGLAIRRNPGHGAKPKRNRLGGAGEFDTTLSLNGANFSYSFPAYSMTVLDLQAGATLPVVNLGGAGGNFAATFIPGAGAVPIVGTGNLTITDSSFSNLTGATVAIGNLQDAASESLAVANVGANNIINGTNITAAYTSGVLTLSGSDTLADYQQVLRTLVYNDTSPNPNRTTRAVTVVVTDAAQSSSAVTSSVAIAPQADLQIAVTDGQTSAIPGAAITYTIVVSNAGPSSVTGATVTDALPATLTGAAYTATATGGATGYAAGGVGNIGDTVNLPSGSTITYVLQATVLSTATGTLANTASVAVPTGTTEINPANNSATDTDTLAPQADLQITSTDGQTSAVPGTVVTYTIIISNAGPSSVTGATVADTLPATLMTATYTATATGGATGFAAGGVGNIGDIVYLPAGSTITYILQATVLSTATGTLANTASVAVPIGTTEINPANNSATDTDTFAPKRICRSPALMARRRPFRARSSLIRSLSAMPDRAA